MSELAQVVEGAIHRLGDCSHEGNNDIHDTFFEIKPNLLLHKVRQKSMREAVHCF